MPSKQQIEDALRAYKMAHACKKVGHDYEIRDRNLLELGYYSYGQYLKSSKWKEIKEKVAPRSKKCVRCGKAAEQIHHGNYDIKTLDGQDMQFLFPVCRRCHRNAEVDKKGKKKTIYAANHYLHALTDEQFKYYGRMCQGCFKRLIENAKGKSKLCDKCCRSQKAREAEKEKRRNREWRKQEYRIGKITRKGAMKEEAIREHRREARALG